MKISAILGKGVKKDFYDLVELLKLFSLNYLEKFIMLNFLIATC